MGLLDAGTPAPGSAGRALIPREEVRGTQACPEWCRLHPNSRVPQKPRSKTRRSHSCPTKSRVSQGNGHTSSGLIMMNSLEGIGPAASYYYNRRQSRRRAASTGRLALAKVSHEDWYDDTVDVQKVTAMEQAGGTWVSLTLDSGAGASVFPYHLPAQDSAHNRKLEFVTATGERLSSGCDCRVEGVDHATASPA